MGSTWSQLWSEFESKFHIGHVVAGVCSAPSLDQVGDLLENASAITGRAKTAAGFANFTQVLGPAGENLAHAADSAHELAERGSSFMGDVSAGCEISEAVALLNEWTLHPDRVSNQEAARAFDKLFGGTSRFFAKLPPPVNSYSQIFAAIKENSFFSNMQKLMDPENPNTPEGRQLRELERSGY